MVSDATNLLKYGVLGLFAVPLLLIVAISSIFSVGGIDPTCYRGGGGTWDVVDAAVNITTHFNFQVDQAQMHRYDGSDSKLNDYWRNHDSGVNFDDIQCVALVRAAYALAGHPLPSDNAGIGTAAEYWPAYQNNHYPGWQTIPAGSEPPLPGDMLVLSGGSSGAGHIAIVVSVHSWSTKMNAPASNSGYVVLAQANWPANILNTPDPRAPEIATPMAHLYMADMSKDNKIDMGSSHTVLGYIRNTSLANQVRAGGSASQRVQAIHQYDTSLYNAEYPAGDWSGAACSEASLAAIFTAYTGHAYTIPDMIKVEVQAGAVVPSSGHRGVMYDLIPNAAKLVGFQATRANMTLDQAITTAQSGTPVMIDIPPDYARGSYPNGHIMVIVGGDAQTVRLADSIVGGQPRVMQRAVFDTLWNHDTYTFAPLPGVTTIQGGSSNCNGSSGNFSATVPPDILKLYPNSPYVQMAWDAALKNQYNPVLFLRQINQESGFNPNASSGPALGIAQFLASTAQSRGLTVNGSVDERLDPQKSLDAAAKWMSQLYQQYLHKLSNNPTPDDQKTAYALALAAYNAGEKSVNDAIALAKKRVQMEAANSPSLYADASLQDHLWKVYWLSAMTATTQDSHQIIQYVQIILKIKSENPLDANLP